MVDATGNVLITVPASGLDRDSVAQVTLVMAIDKSCMAERVGRIAPRLLERMLAGLDIVLGRGGG